MEPIASPTAVLPRPTSATYLVALVDGDPSAPPTLTAVRRLVDRGHRVVVVAGVPRAADVRAAGAEHRPWREARPVEAVAACATDTDRAIGEVRPDAVLVAGPGLGALVAAESATVPLGLLLAGGAVLPGGREQPAWRRLLPRLDEVRAAHGLAPLARVTDQLHRADRHVVVTRPVEAVVDELEALPACRPWLLVARHAPAPSVAREPQLTA